MRRHALILAALLALTGCAPGGSPAAAPAGSPPPTVSENGGFNDTDVMFAQMMLAQYAPAAALLDVARTRAVGEKVKTLTAAIAVTQADERKSIENWLATWKKPLTPGTDAGIHAGHGGLPADPAAELRALREAGAAEFDKVLLNLLIGRQHQAVEYARMELSSGTNAAALALATRVDQSRTAQISMMLGLVG
ncbi:DUF305 domain-containing protein [Catellatospora sp. TT07R-123]|uniref:DUF305 domain-containing protein n=1 Tax=Catellatospora sp. TT07R-123 TaxID=2733863 RepID=UPI001B156D6E|nr:DUF305 domain-containing protein [Catellatospora sp. TT07R-123]GHJ43531.1 DUF305 domain-containing protein [Catellatospora sp. TT07R-123]